MSRIPQSDAALAAFAEVMAEQAFVGWLYLSDLHLSEPFDWDELRRVNGVMAERSRAAVAACTPAFRADLGLPPIQ